MDAVKRMVNLSSIDSTPLHVSYFVQLHVSKVAHHLTIILI